MSNILNVITFLLSSLIYWNIILGGAITVSYSILYKEDLAQDYYLQDLLSSKTFKIATIIFFESF